MKWPLPPSVAVYTLLASMVLCAGLGYLIDRWLDTFPFGLIGGVFGGIPLGLREDRRTPRP